jgi:Flp pilus assembly protein TadG
LFRRRLKKGIADERGAAMILISGSIVALLGISALVVDLGMVRMHRSEARAVVDAAATAGSLDVGEGNGQAGCYTAADYVQINLGKGFSDLDCTTLPASCSPTSTAATATAIDGDWKLTVTYPVPDGNALMTSSAIGATAQTIVYSDGFLCDRLGVTLERTHTTVFGRILGRDKTVTEVHAVAVTRPSSYPDVAVNLVVLERYDCDGLVVEGSGNGVGGIYVDVVTNPDGSISPGYATVDSDATGDGCGTDGTLDTDGANSIVRADGPAGCAAQTGTHTGPGGATIGEGCGIIELLAEGTPGCNAPACTTSGTVNPDPTALGRRVTRAPIDHRYNCKSSYPFPSGWEIRPCPDSPAPYIDNLVSAMSGTGAPSGFKTWQGLGHRCEVEGPVGTVIPVNGDVYVDCDPFIVRRGVHFTGGSVVFSGDVIVEAAGVLAVNGEQGGDPFTPGLDAVEVFVRGGLVRKAGTASLALHNSVVYLSALSQLQMEGGSGILIWTSPNAGPFSNLAMWSESAVDHNLAGNAFLDLEGIFFAPLAKVTYNGNGVQQQVEAQFVARKLAVVGQGVLIVSPKFESVVLIPDDIIALIR